MVFCKRGSGVLSNDQLIKPGFERVMREKLCGDNNVEEEGNLNRCVDSFSGTELSFFSFSRDD